ncbi:MAG TPA: hypothetical protein VFU05_14140 [Cyclobacteriaceae bacterium]|nr:hypothetical protein [Cyclobacteriaceae bacterium]
MALEKDLELLDDYLSNRLSGEERSTFEKRLENDPQLKQELKTQQDFVQGIRNARISELKSMLNNIPVAPASGGQTGMLVKAGSWVAITGLVVTAAFFYFSKDDATETVQEPAPIEQAEEKSNPADPAPAAESTESEIAKPEVKAPVKEKQPEKKSEEVVAPAVTKKPDLKVYDPSKEEAVDESVKKYEQEQLEIISKAFVTSSIEVETESSHKKYHFHYVFSDGKLILYGAFENHLYEILEFISDDKRTVVLFYKTNYYLLDINKSTPTLLTPIKDRKLLKKLSEYGSN